MNGILERLKQISPRMRAGIAISLLLHVVFIGWGLVSFAAKPLASMPIGEPVDIISDKEFSQLMRGQKKAEKSPTPKPLVEKIGEEKPAEDLKAKVSEKKEVVKTADAETPPEPKVEKKEAKPEPEKKADPIAEALKKDEQKKKEEPKKEEAKEEPKKVEPKPKPQPKFDPAKFAALLDKRTPERQAATGSTLNRTASLGATTANAMSLSQNEMDAMRARLMSLWNLPVGVKNPEELNIRIAIRLNRDGTLAAAPQVLSTGRGAAFEAARDSAVRALLQGQPYDMLRPQTYEIWHDMEVVFDAREWFAMTHR